MTSIRPYQTQSGQRWRVTYKRPDGRWTDKRGFTRKADAQAWADGNAVAIRSGEWIDPQRGKVTISELGQAWLDGRTDVKPSWKRSLEIAWRRHVEPRWGELAVEKVTFGDIQAWVSEQTQSATVVRRNHGVLMQILADAVRDQRIGRNPAKGIRLPRQVAKQKRYLAAAQLHRLADASTRPVLVLLLGYTGLRWGEAVALRVMDFDPQRRRVHVRRNAVLLDGQWAVGTPKSHKSRTVPLPALLAARIKAECQGKLPQALIFPGPDGEFMQRPRTSEASGSWWSEACAKVGLVGLTPHDLRHTAASLAISAGAHVKAVQRMLGHASAAMTLDTYTDLFDDDLDALAERLGTLAAPELWANFGQAASSVDDSGHKNNPLPGV